MGSSYADDLARGDMPEEEAKLRQAAALLEEVIHSWYGLESETGQFDNAAQEGALVEALRIAKQIIEQRIPKTKTAS